MDRNMKEIVRTHWRRQKSTLKKLTKEHEMILEDTRIKWRTLYNNFGQDIDLKKLRTGIDCVYALGDFPPPEIVIVDSPFAAQLKANKLNGAKDKFYPFSEKVNIWEMGWAAYHDFWYNIEHNGKPILTDENCRKYIDLISSGLYVTIQFETHCIVSKKPISCIEGEIFHTHVFSDNTRVSFPTEDLCYDAWTQSGFEHEFINRINTEVQKIYEN